MVFVFYTCYKKWRFLILEVSFYITVLSRNGCKKISPLYCITRLCRSKSLTIGLKYSLITSYSNIWLVSVREIHIHTASMASQPHANAKEHWLLWYHRQQNNNYQLQASWPHHFISLTRTYHTPSAAIQRCSHSAKRWRNKPPKIVKVIERFVIIVHFMPHKGKYVGK